MTARLWQEAGVTLVELLVAMTLMLVVLGATLTAFNGFERNNAVNQRQNDAQDEARTAVDSVAREMRNLASPTDEQPQAVNRAEPEDLIFLSVATTKPSGSTNLLNTRRVRYCLNATTREIWRQEQNWTGGTAPGIPTDTSCPAGGWTRKRVVASNVVNGSRPVFNYNATALTEITEAGATLFVDVNPGQRPAETTLQTAVFLRNQNRAPFATFTSSVSGGGIVLNASESKDPEGKGLEYYWFDGSVTQGKCTGLPPEVPASGCVGSGIVFNYLPPAPGSRDVYVVVRDPAGLTSRAPSQTVCVPGAGVTC